MSPNGASPKMGCKQKRADTGDSPADKGVQRYMVGLNHTMGGGKSHTGGLYCQRIPRLEVVYSTPSLHTY